MAGASSTWSHNTHDGNARTFNGHVYGNVVNNYGSNPDLVPKQSSGLAGSPRTLRKEDYTVGWICALAIPEWQASRILLDEEHEDIPLENAQHQYVFGRMNGHNVVMGCLPDGQMGSAHAASVAAEMSTLFKSLRFGLLVGVGGGVWSEERDVRLGDVVVSRPDEAKRNGGVVQYDYGKALQGGEFQETGSLNLPPTILLSGLSKLRSQRSANNQFLPYLKSLEDLEDDDEDFTRPSEDRLFQPDYAHISREATCKKCSPEQLVDRDARTSERPKVHYGTIASGNQVVKDAEKRDLIASRHNILCFEMEAAGLMNQFPCLVVRGICDYCDSHKNKKWQPYAAAAAAAWAKELLRNISNEGILNQRTIGDLVR